MILFTHTQDQALASTALMAKKLLDKMRVIIEYFRSMIRIPHKLKKYTPSGYILRVSICMKEQIASAIFVNKCHVFRFFSYKDKILKAKRV